jgi:integrase
MGKPVWIVRLYHQGRERRFGSFKTKTDAREFYEKAKLEQKLGRFFPERYQQGGFARLEEVLNDYMEVFAGRSRRDEERFKQKWLELFPGARLNALTPSTLEKARAQLAVEGRTPQTVNRYMGFLRRVLNKAIRDKKLFSNPMAGIKMFRESAGRTRYLSPEEEKRLCEVLAIEHARWVRLAILTGMRQMEQFSLRWEDVDLERGLITLPKTKAGRVQYVRLNQEAKDILSQLADETAKRQAVAEAEAIVSQDNRPAAGSPWVFPSENPATHVDPRNFYRRVYLPAVKRMGLEGVSWHTLRHTFASRLAMSGAMEGTIAELLRHSGTALVKRYAHLSDSHLRGEVEKVAAFGKIVSPAPADTVVAGSEAQIVEVKSEKLLRDEQLAAALSETVTGTVTGGQR